jgi:hypothetical protein
LPSLSNDETIATRLREIAINSDGFAFDPRSGESYRMNSTAQLIFNQLRIGMNITQISEALVRDFEVSLETAFEDVQDFLLQLKLQGLV